MKQAMGALAISWLVLACSDSPSGPSAPEVYPRRPGHVDDRDDVAELPSASERR